MPQQLGSKDNSLFRQVVKNYESKQYKKGIRAADQILKKNPNHGDTQAMKALILNSQGQSDEAFALGKEALRNDMKSHICWHVYGLLYRSVRNYEESIKAYKFALKLEPESAQIQRDLATLQVQMRDYAGYVQSRTKMLQARPAIRSNWTALAIAHHLGGDYAEAEKVLSMYEDTLKKPPPKSDIEHSEAVLYKNTVIAESGELERAIEHLESIFKTNLDRTAVMELRADHLLGLDRKEDAATAYRALLDRNNEYRKYYEGLEKAEGIDRTSKDGKKSAMEMYDKYASKSERVDAPRRIPLDFLEGDEFKTHAETYLRRMLQKGVPTTFANVKALYPDNFKKTTIQGIVEGFSSDMDTNGASKDSDDKTAKRFKEFTLYFLAQHYDYHLSRDLPKAMSYIEKALELDPKSVDFNMTKGRILKHKGSISAAADQMDHARGLDEKDRAINTKCAKYQLRDNRNDDALKTMSKFTRNETAGGPLGDLHDMQCVWFITEDGEAYLRQGKLGLALKRFKAIYDIFDTWQDDQYDFHTFSLRKGQIRAYIDMMRWEDRLREHPFYARAAIDAVRAYLRLFDDPEAANGPLPNGTPSLEGLSEAERKKALKKARKEQEKQEKAEAEKRDMERKAANKTKPVSPDGELKKEDQDPTGKTLVQTKEPLTEAVKYLVPVLEFEPRNLEGQNVGFEVYLRKKKYLLALRCLLSASQIDPADPILHEQTVRFQQALSSLPEPLPEKVSKPLTETFTLIPAKTSLVDFNATYLSTHSKSVPHVHAGQRVRVLLDASAQSSAEKELLGTLSLDGVKRSEAESVLKTLKEWKSGIVDEFRSKAHGIWDKADAFR